MIAGRGVLLGIDGGIRRENAGRFAGAGVAVTGSPVFDGRAPGENVQHGLRALGTG